MGKSTARPLEWVVGYLVLALLSALGPAWLAERYWQLDLTQVMVTWLGLTLGMWSMAGMLYHEGGPQNARWARQAARVGQGLSLLGAVLSIVSLVLLIAGQLKRLI